MPGDLGCADKTGFTKSLYITETTQKLQKITSRRVGDYSVFSSLNIVSSITEKLLISEWTEAADLSFGWAWTVQRLVRADSDVSNGFVKDGKMLPYVFEANEAGKN